ncbi:MAG: site-specific integrase [candidate division Zixibacteria bacterium]|nr:site-specific integrase [candidate division Zixibacteria bacterium]
MKTTNSIRFHNMAIFKRNKTYYIQYYSQGRRYREAIRTNYELARRVLAKRQGEIAEGKFLEIRRPAVKFDRLCEICLEWSRGNKKSWQSDQTIINRLSKVFSGKKLSERTVLDVERYKALRIKTVSDVTTNREVALLKHMFNKAVAWNLAKDNPIMLVKLFRKNNARIRHLTLSKIKSLLDECADYIRPIVEFALNMGMRYREIRSLRCGHVDLRNRLIYIDEKKWGRREVPMTDYIFHYLVEHQRASGRVFDEAGGKLVGKMRTAHENAVKRVGISDLTFHELRHAFASHLVMAGVDLLTVKELLGHKSINVTLRYSHLSPAHKRNAVELLRFSDRHFLDTKVKGSKLRKALIHSVTIS